MELYFVYDVYVDDIAAHLFRYSKHIYSIVWNIFAFGFIFLSDIYFDDIAAGLLQCF